MGLADEFDQESQLDSDQARINAQRARRQRDAAEQQLLVALEKIEELEQALGFVNSVNEAVLEPPKWLAPPSSGRKKHATLALLLSDTHFDEVVLPEEVGHLNAYNRQIAEIRLQTWAHNSIKMAKHYLSGMTYDGAVVMLGGD